MKKILLFCILYLPIEPLFGQAFNDLFVGNFKFLNLLPNIKDKEHAFLQDSNLFLDKNWLSVLDDGIFKSSKFADAIIIATPDHLSIIKRKKVYMKLMCQLH